MSDTTISSTLEIRGITIPNRIVMPPLVIWQSGEDGRVRDVHLDHYRRSLGPGLIIVEATCVSPEGRLAATQLGLWEDAQIRGMEALARLIRDSGAIPGIQIHHAGSTATRQKTYGLTPLAPSVPVDGNPEAEALTQGDIKRIVGCFANAAERAVQAGFQVMEIHGAHGYLGSQFLSPQTNRRDDGYGGDVEGRTRFLREVCESVAGRIGEAALVSCRLGVAGKDGLSISDGLATAEILEATGLDLIHISHGGGGVPEDLERTDGAFSSILNLSRLAKERLSIPVIGVGGIKTGEQAENAVREGFADLIAVGKGILADPGWTHKALQGQDDRISLCIDCKPRCFHFADSARCPARKKLLQQDNR